MKAAVVEQFGAAPKYKDFAEPVAAAGEKLVRVSAVGLHPIVKALAAGSHYGSTGELPFIVGVDGVGKLEDGTRVYFGTMRKPFGTFAEIAPAPEWITLNLPDALADEAAAALANPGMSSWAALKYRALFKADERVLILGATGVAGHLAVQIAKRLGARRVVACGRNHAALEECRALGADASILLNQEHGALVAALRKEFAENGVDVVLDYVWGAPAQATFEAILVKGFDNKSKRIRYIQIGESAGSKIELAASVLRSSGVEVLGSGFGSVELKDIMKAVAEFFAEAAKKPFAMKIDQVPLSLVESAWARKEEAVRIVFRP
ncbi:MAG: zinc-binding alcohol dehydrogenase family protein [Candidatus Acidiferrales bacterium]|jgi:NADPH2:quinone reductase